MPSYDYKCKPCEKVITLDRSMNDDSAPTCNICGSEEINRIWSVSFVVSGGSTPDVGQGSFSSAAAPRKSGCGSCSSHNCGTC